MPHRKSEYHREIAMSDQQKETDKTLRDDTLAAVVVSGSIVTFFVVYWFFERQSVRELLEMAYG